MKYLHYVIEDGKQIESQYSNSAYPKVSMQCLAQIKKGIYYIWDREENIVSTTI